MKSEKKSLDAYHEKLEKALKKNPDYVLKSGYINYKSLHFKNPALKDLKDKSSILDIKELDSSVTKNEMKQLKEVIKDQMELKIQIFFTQMLLVAGSKKKYHLHNTEEQYAKGTKKYHAAHAANIPSFKSRDKSGEFDVAQGTSFGKIFNTTTILPIEANRVDSYIDGTNNEETKNPKMRVKALKILSQIANEDNVKTISQQFSNYLKLFTEQISASYGHYSEYEYPQKSTLRWYGKVIEKYQDKLAGDEAEHFLKKLCLAVKEVKESKFEKKELDLKEYVESETESDINGKVEDSDSETKDNTKKKNKKLESKIEREETEGIISKVPLKTFLKKSAAHVQKVLNEDYGKYGKVYLKDQKVEKSTIMDFLTVKKINKNNDLKDSETAKNQVPKLSEKGLKKNDKMFEKDKEKSNIKAFMFK